MNAVGALIALALFGSLVAGWVNNIIWTFHQHDLGNIALGILGAVVAIIGAVHGIYLWF